MKTKLVVLAVAFLLISPAAIAASSPLHGIWKVDTASISAKLPYAFVIKDGVYECMSCVPQFRLSADGGFHAVPSNALRDMVAVKLLDSGAIQIMERKNGVIVADTILRVANDHSSLAEVTRRDLTGMHPVVSRFYQRRVSTAPEGAHAGSGSWQEAVYTDLSDNGRAFTYRVNGNRLHMNDARGHAFVAYMDGSEAAYTGSQVISRVTVEKLAPHRVRLVARHEGQIVAITTLHVLPNGEMMRVVRENRLDGSRLSYIATRLRSTSLAPPLAPLGGAALDGCPAGECASAR